MCFHVYFRYVWVILDSWLLLDFSNTNTSRVDFQSHHLRNFGDFTPTLACDGLRTAQDAKAFDLQKATGMGGRDGMISQDVQLLVMASLWYFWKNSIFKLWDDIPLRMVPLIFLLGPADWGESPPRWEMPNGDCGLLSHWIHRNL